MTDFVGLGISAAGVIGATFLGYSFGVPDWVVLGIAASAGSVLSAYWKLSADREKGNPRPLSKTRAILMLTSGTITGIAIAKLVVGISGLEAQTITWVAFFFAHIGADVSRELSSQGNGMSAALLALLRKIISKE